MRIVRPDGQSSDRDEDEQALMMPSGKKESWIDLPNRLFPGCSAGVVGGYQQQSLFAAGACRRSA